MFLAEAEIPTSAHATPEPFPADAAPSPRREVRCEGCCAFASQTRCEGCGRMLCGECASEHRYREGACVGRRIVDDGESME